jgi:hypothetical protein
VCCGGLFRLTSEIEAPGQVGRCWEIIFWGLMGLAVLPIWLAHYFPTSDGPAHVANAFVMRHYTDPAFPEFRRFYEFNPKPVPNYLTHLILSALMSLWSPATAEKIFLTIYTVLLPLSARYACSSAGSRFAVLLIFPFAQNFLFLNGFYNFCVGLPMFFLIAGYCLGAAKPLRVKQTLILSGLLIVQYFCHTVPLAVSLLVAGSILFSAWWDDRNSTNRLSSAFHALPLAAAATPLFLLSLLFLSHRDNRVGFSIGIVDRITQLVTSYSLVSYDRKEALLSIPVAATFLVLALAGISSHKQNRVRKGLLISVVSCTLLYLVSPNSIGSGTFITERILLLLYFCLILWLASLSFSRRMLVGLQVAAVAISLAFTVQHTFEQRKLKPYIEELLTISAWIPPHTTVFPVIYSFRGESPDGRELAHRVMPFANLSSWIAAERGVVDLRNYEAWTGDFPLRFRRELDPSLHLSTTPGGMYSQPPAVDLLGYARQTGAEIGYVIIWSFEKVEANPWSANRWSANPRSAAILGQLGEAYDLVATSTPHGYARLYRLRVKSAD